jgi:WD40 repeat protein
VAALAFCAAGLGVEGCSDEQSLIDPGGEPYPIAHRRVAWVSEDVLAFENSGAIEMGPGWARIDPELAGVIVWDCQSGDWDVAIPGGVGPSAAEAAGQVVALLGYGGDLVSYSESQVVIVPESLTWEGRYWLALSRDARAVAWRSYGSDHEVGVWVLDISEGNYTYLGDGIALAFSPTSDRLLYQPRTPGAPASLVLYDLGSAEHDTLFTFPENEGCTHAVFSPDGSRLAYFLTSTDNSRWGLYIRDISTGEQRQYVHARGLGLDWGPRGIVYSNGCTSSDPGCGVLWLLDPESGIATRLTSRLQFVP